MLKTIRKYHKPIGIISLTPLLLQTISGIGLQYTTDWDIDLDRPVRRFFMTVHTFGHSWWYSYLLGVCLILLCLTGVSMIKKWKF